ncbi:MAG: hypothetical protein ACOYU1_10570 [Bacteroidota bacterium]|jgi:hypothetical protein
MKRNEFLSTRASVLLFKAIVTANNENEARDKARSKMFSEGYRLLNDTFRIETKKIGDGLFECLVFNFYYMERIGLKNRILHAVRKLRATALSYIGVVPRVVVIE